MNPVPAVKIEAELLVIGYGNTLRGDDGVGPRVAEAVEKLNLPGGGRWSASSFRPSTPTRFRVSAKSFSWMPL